MGILCPKLIKADWQRNATPWRQRSFQIWVRIRALENTLHELLLLFTCCTLGWLSTVIHFTNKRRKCFLFFFFFFFVYYLFSVISFLVQRERGNATLRARKSLESNWNAAEKKLYELPLNFMLCMHMYLSLYVCVYLLLYIAFYFYFFYFACWRPQRAARQNFACVLASFFFSSSLIWFLLLSQVKAQLTNGWIIDTIINKYKHQQQPQQLSKPVEQSRRRRNLLETPKQASCPISAYS